VIIPSPWTEIPSAKIGPSLAVATPPGCASDSGSLGSGNGIGGAGNVSAETLLVVARRATRDDVRSAARAGDSAADRLMEAIAKNARLNRMVCPFGLTLALISLIGHPSTSTKTKQAN
jgi:hypothetical protein